MPKTTPSEEGCQVQAQVMGLPALRWGCGFRQMASITNCNRCHSPESRCHCIGT